MKKELFNGLDDSTNKEKILSKVRSALMTKDENLFSDIDLQTDTWKPFNKDDGPEFTFIEKFKSNGGIFIYLRSLDMFRQYVLHLYHEKDWRPMYSASQKIIDIFKEYEIDFNVNMLKKGENIISLTSCECLIAQTGSIVLSNSDAGSLQSYAMADSLLVFATPQQIVHNMKEASLFIKNKYHGNNPSNVTIISGPNRSRAIDNEVITGATGIKQIVLFLTDI